MSRYLVVEVSCLECSGSAEPKLIYATDEKWKAIRQATKTTESREFDRFVVDAFDESFVTPNVPSDPPAEIVALLEGLYDFSQGLEDGVTGQTAWHLATKAVRAMTPDERMKIATKIFGEGDRWRRQVVEFLGWMDEEFLGVTDEIPLLPDH